MMVPVVAARSTEGGQEQLEIELDFGKAIIGLLGKFIGTWISRFCASRIGCFPGPETLRILLLWSPLVGDKWVAFLVRR